MNCTVSNISNRTNKFDFEELFAIYLYLNQTCPPESNIFFPGSRMLTELACRTITATSSSAWTGWSPYPIYDIWTRIVTWKLPLFQLVSQFPRPPLGFGVETATLTHLLGDPIDSIMSMLLTLSICTTRSREAKMICQESGIDPSIPEYHRIWKSLAIISVSYDECGLAEKADDIIREYGRLSVHADFHEELRHVYTETASCLAADRQTKILPMAIAQIFFISGWIIALIKAASSEPNATNWVNIEAHSIAFSATYLWVTSAVGIGSIIGASQTEDSIPRLLQRFENDMANYRGGSARRASDVHRKETVWCKTGTDRAFYGGVYSWRPTKWTEIDAGALIACILVATAAVGSGTLAGTILSYLVPPRGLSCRHIGELVMFLLWATSFVIGSLVERWLRKGIFWTVFWKDLFFAVGNISVVLVTQWGIMNRCSCWSMWGFTGLHLPQMPEFKHELMKLIRQKAPWIVFMAIFLQLIFCAAVAWNYWDAVRVFVQRDDGISNSSWETRKTKRKVIQQDV